MQWRDRNVLVTGASGFIGGHLADALVRRGANVWCLMCELGPRAWMCTSGAASTVTMIDGRVESYEQLLAALLDHEIDTVFHLAARTLVGAARHDPRGVFETNIRGTWHVLEAARQSPSVRSVVVASSDKAYGDADELPYTEGTELAGRFPYDVSKACADMLAQSYAATYQLPVAIARCGNVFGPGDLNYSRLIPGTIRSLLRGQRPIIRSDGAPQRDYLYVADAVEGYLALAAWVQTAGDVPWTQRSFNFGPSRPLSVTDIVRRIQVAAGCANLDPIIEGTARCEIRHQHLDASRAREILRWQCRHGMETALATTVAWYRAQLEPAPQRRSRPHRRPVTVHVTEPEDDWP